LVKKGGRKAIITKREGRKREGQRLNRLVFLPRGEARESAKRREGGAALPTVEGGAVRGLAIRKMPI